MVAFRRSRKRKRLPPRILGSKKRPRNMGKLIRDVNLLKRSTELRAAGVQETGSLTTSLVYHPFNDLLDQGDTVTLREGNKIMCKNVIMELVIRAAEGQVVPRRVRVFIGYQTYDIVSLPVFNDILATNAAVSLKVGRITSRSPRVRIWKQWDWMLQPVVPAAGGPVTYGKGSRRIIKFFKHFKNGHQITFVGTGAGQQAKGAIFVAMITESGTTLPTFSLQTRNTFVA